VLKATGQRIVCYLAQALTTPSARMALLEEYGSCTATCSQADQPPADQGEQGPLISMPHTPRIKRHHRYKTALSRTQRRMDQMIIDQSIVMKAGEGPHSDVHSLHR